MTGSARRLIHAPSTSHLHLQAFDFLNTHAQTLVLAPTRATADDLVRAACTLPGQGLLATQRLTLTQLAAQLAAPALAAKALKPASRLAIEALTTRIIATAEKAGQIPYFSPVATTPGLAPAIAATLTELRLERIRTLASPDLSTLLNAFEDDRSQEGLADLAVVFDLALEALDDDNDFAVPLLILDVPLPTQSHRDLLRKVAGKAPAVLALALSGEEDQLARALGIKPELAMAADTPLDRIAQSLFAVNTQTTVDAPVEFFSAAGEGLECVEIARRIRKSGTPFDKIAVLLRSPERYQSLLEEALRRAEIPAWFSRGIARPDPAGRAFLALLACAQEKCSASRFAEYLSLGQVPTPEDLAQAPAPLPPDDELLASFFPSSSGTGAAVAPEPQQRPIIAPIFWERLIVDAAVVGGRARWERRLKGLENEFRFHHATLERENSPRAEFAYRQIERLQSLKSFALPLIAELDTLPETALWGEWLDRLAALARLSLRRPESVWSVLDELRAMESIGPVDLNEVYVALAERLRFLRRDSGQSRYGRVFVGSIAEARGRAYDVVFLPGLAEGLFPRRPQEDPILLDDHRKLIDPNLKTQDDRVADERHLLRMAVGAARERLVYSYPRMDVMQNRPRVPSFYALELLRAVEGKLPDLKHFERQAAEAAPTRLDWPAPRNPIDAIDDAEFDLSMLGHIMQLPPADAKGTGHYLIAANTHLVRSLRSRARRWRSKWFNVDGLVEPKPETLTQLEQFRLSAKPYSPSSLQQYADCPYRFFLYAIQRLEPRETPSALEQMDPLTRGSLFHETQQKLMESLQQQHLLPVTQDRLPQALFALDQALDATAAAYAEDLAPAIDRVWKSEVEELRTDLRGWLQHVAMNSPMWLPRHFELEFDRTAILDGYLVKGKIDLVEQHTVNGTIRITDHKTGSFPDKPPAFVGGGKTLQPILYSLAARTEMDANVSSGRLYFCTRKGKYQDIDIRLTPDAEEKLAQVLHTVDEAIGKGFLPAAPALNACEYCDYSSVCGPYEEQRVARKQRANLEPLQALRRLP